MYCEVVPLTEEELKDAYQKRLAFIGNKDNADAMAELKKNFTFHSCKFEEDMERWFDMWKRTK